MTGKYKQPETDDQHHLAAARNDRERTKRSNSKARKEKIRKKLLNKYLLKTSI